MTRVLGSNLRLIAVVTSKLTCSILISRQPCGASSRARRTNVSPSLPSSERTRLLLAFGAMVTLDGAAAVLAHVPQNESSSLLSALALALTVIIVVRLARSADSWRFRAP